MEWEKYLKSFNLMVARTTRDNLIHKIQSQMTPEQINQLKERILQLRARETSITLGAKLDPPDRGR